MCNRNAKDQVNAAPKFTPRLVLSFCRSTDSVCVFTRWCHCQTHVLMAPDIHIFPFLQGAIGLSWEFTVCSACIPLVYRSHLSLSAIRYLSEHKRHPNNFKPDLPRSSPCVTEQKRVLCAQTSHSHLASTSWANVTSTTSLNILTTVSVLELLCHFLVKPQMWKYV